MTRSARAADLLALLAGLAVATYATLRASLIPITHDEAFSYLRFVAVPLAESFSLDGTDSANNHFLLTLLDRLLVAVLGPSELVLRLPVLIAFVAALVAAWLILRGRCPPAVALAGFLVIGLNRLGAELFSLARGYGLAVGIALCGIYLLVRAVERDLRSAPALAGLSLLVLAALAQLTLLDVWAAASAAFLLGGLVRAFRRGDDDARVRSPLVRAAWVVALPAVACGATAIPIALAMRSGGALYAGGRGGLLRDTVGSLVRETLEPAPWAGTLRGAASLAIVLAAVSVALGVGAILASRNGNVEEAGAVLVGATFVLTVVAVEAQVRLLGVGYPVDRMAFSFLPLLVLSSCLVTGWLLRNSGPLLRRAANVLAGLVSIAAVNQLAATADLSRSRLWWFDADSPRVLEEIGRRVSARAPADSTVSVGISWILEPGLNYYRVVRGMKWLHPLDRAGLGGQRDFYVVASPDTASADAGGLTAVRTFERAGTVLAIAGPGRIRAGVTPLRAAGAILILPTDPVPNRLESVSWVPVVVRSAGLDGAEWRSDLKVVNRSESPARVVVSMSWKGELRQGAVGVPAEGEAIVEDVAGQLGVEGSGPLEVRSRGDIEISASVYDATGTGGRPLAGTQWFGSVRPGDGLGSGAVGRIEGLEESHRARTNVAFLNLGPTASEIDVSYGDPRGKTVDTSRRLLQPGEWIQETRPLAAFAEGAEMVGACARIRVARGEGIVAWATVINTSTHEVRVSMALR